VVLDNKRGSKEQEPEQELYILPHVLRILDEFVSERGWVPVGTFVRDDPALFAEIADDLDEDARARIAKNIEGQPEWHDPSVCLTTIQELLAYLKNTSEGSLAVDFGEAQDEFAVKAILSEEGCTFTEAVCKDLEECARQLRKAEQSHRRFRFEIG
jgi:hypothetical protein